MSHAHASRRVWTQHVIAPFTHLDRRPAHVEPAGDGIALAHVPPARRSGILRMLESCREEISERLDLGALGWEADGRRHVLAWGLVDFSVALDGTDMRADWPEHEPEMGRHPVRADLSVPIGGTRWYTAFDPLIHRAADRAGIDTRMLSGGPGGEWARHTLRRTFRRYVDWNRLRRAVLAYLAPEPLTVSLTRRLFEGCAPCLRQFNWVHRHSRGLARVAIEHPRLLPFLQLVAGGEDEDPLERLEHVLREAGIGVPARRKLELWGWPVFAEASDACFSDPVVAVAQLANTLDRLRVDREPPSLFGAVALADGKPHPEWFLRALLDEMLCLAEAGLADMVPDSYSEALAWLRGRPRPPDANQARTGWRWIEAQASAHAVADDEEARRPWAVPCDDFESGPWRVVALRNPLELRDEARAMRNCLSTYEADCRFEAAAIYSIRDLASGRRVACFALELDLEHGVWQLGQVAGPGNGRAPAELVELAMTAIGRCRPPRDFVDR